MRVPDRPGRPAPAGAECRAPRRRAPGFDGAVLSAQRAGRPALPLPDRRHDLARRRRHRDRLQLLHQAGPAGRRLQRHGRLLAERQFGGFFPTWRFLDRRIDETMQIPKITQRLKKTLEKLPDPRNFLKQAPAISGLAAISREGVHPGPRAKYYPFPVNGAVPAHLARDICSPPFVSANLCLDPQGIFWAGAGNDFRTKSAAMRPVSRWRRPVAQLSCTGEATATSPAPVGRNLAGLHAAAHGGGLRRFRHRNAWLRGPNRTRRQARLCTWR